MKKCVSSINFKGAISLTVSPSDSAAWKFSMLMEAASQNSRTIEEIANSYGYTREYFYEVKKRFDTGGLEALKDKVKGPKSNYKRTKIIDKEIIKHRFLDPEANCEVIAQKMNQAGFTISQRSVERTINEYGLQKKGYIKLLKAKTKEP